MRENVNTYNGLRVFIDNFVNENTIVAEVGSFQGESSVMFAAKAKKVYCIDPWDGEDAGNYGGAHIAISEVEKTFNEATKDFQNIEKIKKLSDDAAADFEDNSIDFLYIDGMHTEEQVRKDIFNFFPKVKPDGIIGGHDLNYSIWGGVSKAVREILGEPHLVFPDTSWAFQKKYFAKSTLPSSTERFAEAMENFHVVYEGGTPFIIKWNVDEKGNQYDYRKEGA